jgi:ribosome-associated translation inhibitor RaiA
VVAIIESLEAKIEVNQERLEANIEAIQQWMESNQERLEAEMYVAINAIQERMETAIT